jgi:hypothetical protein
VKLGLPNANEAVFSSVNLCALDSMQVYWDGAVRASLRNF